MVQSTEKVLESFFTDYGWNIRLLEDGEWLSGWSGKERHFPLRISLYNTWISFRVQPFLKLDVDWESWPEISKFLLELNNSCHMVKIVIDDECHISLELEIFSKSLSFEDFENAISVIGYYSDYLYDEILNFLDTIGYQYSYALKFLT